MYIPSLGSFELTIEKTHILYVTLKIASVEELERQFINKPAVFKELILLIFRIVLNNNDKRSFLLTGKSRNLRENLYK